ncbi:membrane protein [Chlamydia psittaci NJ1]|uniref:Membrane protein n=1 Tax=Chlamydia psittaci 99DC5 TaxID=1112251 RepID=A0ABP2X3G2_CHLPS|nr:putative membrane protein [Chlamydia psittaci 84/55]AFS20110.1 putative membrane protein [Chlamydia psittaci GR9]AFS21321.1 putative membrane protein [Chlamydia psittaci MN]AFS22186.1 putative membrane protein [Chlamydia psittaci VS225]AFS23725.1 putative membrane protein [Chlamydia psittaci WS/RT/E30]AFS24514.1 putative membrane protein [Chlamydia psittaci M56]AFS25658.1 putative membrane protein [Chlamydia psittaci WC]AFS26426.1 putative membrane protein [Chlamydia psittaci CP3]AFS2754
MIKNPHNDSADNYLRVFLINCTLKFSLCFVLSANIIKR